MANAETEEDDMSFAKTSKRIIVKKPSKKIIINGNSS